ncbi:FAD-dependent monooxygenase [Streptomyces sp. NPDC091215]|uniref:FAD-dependent monooxygenase n=1 Tax=Streptomyces sp. NPDC091215 TaxID=3155192 RepID=UPI00341A6578
MHTNGTSLSAATGEAEYVPVLIVGSGPAGLTTALSLARQGIRSVVVTRHATQAHTPRAHITNQRTVEILADLGVEEEVRAVGYVLEEFPNNPFMLTFAGPEAARCTAWGGGLKDQSRYRSASRHLPLDLSQHLLEPILARAAVDTGLVDLRYRHEFLSLDQDDAGVSATIRERRSGREYVVRSEYLVGADGARSKVMQQIGLTLHGLRDLATNCTAWLDVDLTPYTAHRPAAIYWAVDLSFPSWTMVHPWHQWVANWSIEPGHVPDKDEVIAKVRESVGDPHIEVGVRSIGTWTINQIAADQYSVGRVFCMGDAVHQHSPANGLGSNTSIADGYNLAWKLAYVLTGMAGPALLETYSPERAPVGRQVVDRTLQSGAELFTLRTALDIDAAGPESRIWEQIHSLRDATPEAAKRRDKVADMMRLLDYNFNAHGVELGYRYDVVRPEVGRDDDIDDRRTSDDITYIPSTALGEHLPHASVEYSRRQLSTVDLIGHGRFTVITGRGGEEWVGAADEARRRFGIPLTVRVIGTADGYQDVLGEWERVRGIDDDGCLLVRPDGHIAWRAQSNPDGQALLDAIAIVLGQTQGVGGVEPASAVGHGTKDADPRAAEPVDALAD